MRKVRLALLFACVVALLLLVLVPTAGAAQKSAASGSWAWGPGPDPTEVRYTGGDNWFATQPISGYFNGTFQGTYDGSIEIVFFKTMEERCWLNFHYALNFTGSVNEVPGTAVMRFTCRPQMFDGEGNTWQVIGGSGGLKHLVGHGTWGWNARDEGAYTLWDYAGTVWLP